MKVFTCFKIAYSLSLALGVGVPSMAQPVSPTDSALMALQVCSQADLHKLSSTTHGAWSGASLGARAEPSLELQSLRDREHLQQWAPLAPPPSWVAPVAGDLAAIMTEYQLIRSWQARHPEEATSKVLAWEPRLQALEDQMGALSYSLRPPGRGSTGEALDLFHQWSASLHAAQVQWGYWLVVFSALTHPSTRIQP